MQLSSQKPLVWRPPAPPNLSEKTQFNQNKQHAQPCALTLHGQLWSDVDQPNPAAGKHHQPGTWPCHTVLELLATPLEFHPAKTELAGAWRALHWVQTPVLFQTPSPSPSQLAANTWRERAGLLQEQGRASHGFPCSRMKDEGRHLLNSPIPLLIPASFLAGWSPLTRWEVEIWSKQGSQHGSDDPSLQWDQLD